MSNVPTEIFDLVREALGVYNSMKQTFPGLIHA